MKKLINSFKGFLGLKHEINNKPYIKILNRFFIKEDVVNKIPETITKIQVFKKRDLIILLIESHRPGLLIGKGGRFIDSMKKFLIMESNEIITINIQECKLWHRS